MRPRIDFGALARFALRARRMTTRELAKALGISQPHASRLARGQAQSIAADAALQLIELVGGDIRLPDEVTREPSI